MLRDGFFLGNILQKDIKLLRMKKYGWRANEELRGEEADFEVADISMIPPGPRFAMDTSQRDLGRIALTRITSTETSRASYENCEVKRESPYRISLNHLDGRKRYF